MAEEFTVQLPDGTLIKRMLPDGATDAQVRAAFKGALSKAGFAAERSSVQRPSNEDYWREKLGDQGEISEPDFNIGETLESSLGDLLANVLTERDARRIAGKAFSAVNDVTPVGDAVSLDRARQDFGRGNYFGAAINGLTGAIGAIPGLGDVAAGAAKAMFAGPLAKNANLNAMRQAEQMTALGADRRQIWDETGWFQGADGKWRFEIDDSASRYIPDVEGARTVSDIYQHPSLYEAYPSLKTTSAAQKSMNDPPGGETRGYYDTEAKQVVINDLSGSKTGRSTTSHELQHVIQEIEGFGMGGSPSQYVQQNDAKLAAAALGWRREITQTMEANPGLSWADAERQVMDDYRGLDIGDWIPPDDARQVAADIVNNPDEQIAPLVQLYGLDRYTSPRTPMQMYRGLAGEVEARNVQGRIDLTPEQRRASPPWMTQDLADPDQIVRFK